MIGAGDATLAGSLISSPLWAPWLADVNAVLSVLTVLVGLILGVYRLWCAYQDRQDKISQRDD